MQADSQFVDDYVAGVQDEPPAYAREHWIDLQLARDFMRNSRASLVSGGLAVAITFTLLYGYVVPYGLWIWGGLGVAVLAYRYFTLKEFDRLQRAAAIELQQFNVRDFFDRYAWSWPVSAVVYALPVFFYFDRAPAAVQYLCLVILVGIGAISASLMAARVHSQRQFAHGLCGTTLLAILFSTLQQWPKFPDQTTLTLMLLIIVFWVLIIHLGRHLHSLQLSSYGAQFGNEQLIHSLRQQTQAATDAVQMKNSLLASAAHDLRQPVHALAFYADWLRNEPQLADQVVPKILAATDSVNTLFNSLFDFARIESGAIQIKVDDVNIVALIEEMSVQFSPAADAKGLILKTQSVPIYVRSDPVLLRRITANLLANAIRYTQKGGVMLSARVVGGRLWLEVSDSGVGISREHLPHVFKEFYRAPLHQGTADSFGLGLAIVQRLCRALGHVITLRSAVGKGTLCRLELPLSKHEEHVGNSVPMALDDAEKMYAQMMPRERAQ